MLCEEVEEMCTLTIPAAAFSQVQDVVLWWIGQGSVDSVRWHCRVVWEHQANCCCRDNHIISCRNYYDAYGAVCMMSDVPAQSWEVLRKMRGSVAKMPKQTFHAFQQVHGHLCITALGKSEMGDCKLMEREC